MESRQWTADRSVILCLTLLWLGAFPALSPAQASRQVSFPTVETQAGANLTVPLNINDASRIAGANFTVRFDPVVATSVAPTVATTSLTNDFALTINAIRAPEGILRFALARTTGIPSGSGALVNLFFTVKSDARLGASGALEILDVRLFDEQAAPIAATAVNGRVTIPLPPDTLPTISNPSANPTNLPRKGGKVTISATITDDKGVTAAWALINGSVKVSLQASGNSYSARWKAPKNDGRTPQQYTITIHARDTANQENSKPAGAVTVNGKKKGRQQSVSDNGNITKPGSARFQRAVHERLALRLLSPITNSPTHQLTSPLILTYTLTKPAHVTARVLSPTGKVVRQFSARQATAGANALLWDGKAQTGGGVLRGVYLIEIVAQDEDGQVARATQTVMVR